MPKLNQEQTEMIINHLLDINTGRCSIVEQDILDEEDPALQEILTGLLFLHENLEFREEQSKTLEEELRVQVNYMENVITSMADSLIVVNPDATIRSVNQATLHLLGYREKELLGRDVADIFSTEQRLFQMNGLEKLINQGSIKNQEMIFMAKDKRKIPVLFSGSVMRNEKGRIQGIVCVATDITERKQMEDQLIQSHKMEALGTLAGGIAHDFNNILATISGNAEMSLMKLSHDSDCKQNVESISVAAKRAASLVRQILTFSRMETTSLTPTNLSTVVEEALVMIRATIPANIQIRHDLQADSFLVKADMTQIHQILINLCTNAYHAIGEKGGSIEVSLRNWKIMPSSSHEEDGDYLKLSVTDTGRGIAPEDQEKVFDPFYTTKDIGKGTGLGLSVVHGVVEKHGGKIVIDSELGRGTTVSIYFPAIAESIDEHAAILVTNESIAEQAGGYLVSDKREGHILVVDDEPDVVHLYREFFEDQGYVVTLCDNGTDALALFSENPNRYDLVLTDQAMPSMTGKELTRKLLLIRSDIPVILSTGFSDAIDEAEAKALGFYRYLQKPVKLATLQKTIEDCLRESG